MEQAVAETATLDEQGLQENSPRARLARGILWVLLIAAVLIAPLFLYPVFVMQLLCFALFACAFNLLIGFTGLLSFGHAAFFGGAAYIAGHVIKVWGFPPLFGILTGALFAAVLGYVIGALAIRRQGIYFAMITLALAQIVYFFALQLPFTGGENGLQGIPRGTLFGIVDLGQPLQMYYFVAAIFIVGFLIIYRTIHSPFGQVLQAIRENEPRALSLGYDVDRFKLIAFIISASLAGLAGATKAVVFQFASLTDAHWQMSGEVILMTLLGGMGTIFGPVIGAVTIVTLQHELAGIGSWVQVVIGVTFIAAVLLFRRGIIGEIARLLKISSV
ncbi:branched-chain amino acid ABC transporter permease [Rhizobium sp. NRK18]|uniref:branched-chain amino acid ABC transporter permease n=1 Tax=Rhizobium sp. NRK18 TaxID=2964667 RepID=UPI0021C40B92|nr:branched-chain amino acid ABC transporter permease [Rhizobium sp. NRK18]MCQ2005925.1 branched-chain amino acid ABC transporter permease [Rhizobium sp. NRK18]